MKLSTISPALLGASILFSLSANAATFVTLQPIDGFSLAGGAQISDTGVIVGYTSSEGIIYKPFDSVTQFSGLAAVEFSADGSTVVGPTDTNDIGYVKNGVYTSIQMGGNDGRWQGSWGVNGDGSKIVGQYQDEGFLWSEATGLVGMGDILGRGNEVGVWGISQNGEFITGAAQDGLGSIQAFVWSENNGLQLLDGLSEGRALEGLYVSEDGKVVTGSSSYGGTFRWSESQGMVDITQVGTPRAMSGDGNIILGEVHGTKDTNLWVMGLGIMDAETFLLNQGLDISPWVDIRINDISNSGEWMIALGEDAAGQFDPLLINLAASAVPVPGAVWLFGSALIGLAGLARRR